MKFESDFRTGSLFMHAGESHIWWICVYREIKIVPYFRPTLVWVYILVAMIIFHVKAFICYIVFAFGANLGV